MPTFENQSLGSANFVPRSTPLNHQNGVKTAKMLHIFRFFAKSDQNNRYFKHFALCPGDLVSHTGDQELRSVSGRLPENPGALA